MKEDGDRGKWNEDEEKAKMWMLIKKAMTCNDNNNRTERQWERRHLYSNVALPVPLYSILKRWFCCCYLYLWIHTIWPSVKWWVIPVQQEELVLNLELPPSHAFPSPPSIFSSLLFHVWICWIWMEVEGWEWEGRWGRERIFLWLRLLRSPVSHLRRCGTRINGIQEHS